MKQRKSRLTVAKKTYLCWVCDYLYLCKDYAHYALLYKKRKMHDWQPAFSKRRGSCRVALVWSSHVNIKRMFSENYTGMCMIQMWVERDWKETQVKSQSHKRKQYIKFLAFNSCKSRIY